MVIMLVGPTLLRARGRSGGRKRGSAVGLRSPHRRDGASVSGCRTHDGRRRGLFFVVGRVVNCKGEKNVIETGGN